MTNVRLFTRFVTILALVAGAFALDAAEPPKVGDTAPDFTLDSLDGKTVTLSQETAKRPVVLVVLRGWPGYQCPICTRQVHDFVQQANALAGKAQVLMVWLCTVIVSLCHAVATDIEFNAARRRCFHSYGSLALTRLVRA